MCLNIITKTFNPPDSKVRTGWKYVEKTNGKLFSMYQGGSELIVGGDWESAVPRSVTTNPLNLRYSERPTYTSGFHVFPSREEARKAKRALTTVGGGVFARLAKRKGGVTLVKVEVTDVTYEGIDGTTTDSGYLDAKIKTLVANSMRIIAEVKD